MRQKPIKYATIIVLLALILTSCAADTKEITVISRESGSGTRSAFATLSGLESDGIDITTIEAIITNSTAVMLTTVSRDKNAIGYVSLGSLLGTVKAVTINGVYPSIESVAAGEYELARPFFIATNGEVTGLAADFIAFILSAYGQRVIREAGYVPVSDGGEYVSSNNSGKLSIGGSSSVTPVMEKLVEAYAAANANVVIELQQSDSSSGLASAASGVFDIGLSSRELKESELEDGLRPVQIALDAIAVIVSPENPVDGLTSDELRGIFTGEITHWNFENA